MPTNAASPTPSWRSDRRLAIAVVGAVLLHGGLLAGGSYRGTYDAYVHMFFADHYAETWFSTWEPRWYTGFSVVSYPPGAHQLVALGSRVLGLELAFAAVQLLAVVGLVVGVYRFSGLWVGRRAAGWAAIAMAVSSSLTEVVHVFGQLPTTVSLALLLNAQPSIRRWVHDACRSDLLAAVALLAATTACHHVTTLFGSVFFTGPVVARAVLDHWARPHRDEVAGHPMQVSRANLLPLAARRIRRALPAIARATLLGVLTLTALIAVILPYWLWSSSDPITQVPIPHGSRSNFLTDTDAGLVFWVIPWASILLLVPHAIGRGALGRAWPLAASVAMLALLGTGGTTPLPRLLLGGAFEILTLDRFTIWATIAVLPLVGTSVESLVNGSLRRRITGHLGAHAAVLAGVGLLAVAIASTTVTGALTNLRPMQPDPIDPDPIVEFIAKDGHDRWRYLTLGFGDQMAWVSANTNAETVDGNYHSARRLPELTTRSVERLEGAKYQGVPGIGSLQQFVGHPGRYHLKFVFSADEFYDPLLWGSGWQRLDRLRNGVVVWEKPDVAPLPELRSAREIPGWQRLAWGTLPLGALAAAAVALGWTALGRPGARLVDARVRRSRSLVNSIDRRLAATAARLEPGGERRAWSGLAAAMERARDRWAHPAPVSLRRRRLQQLMVIGATICLLAFAAQHLAGTQASDPGDIVVAYYDDLDFGRFDRAWGRLDPDTRPALADYDLERSVRDGLLDGYGKLDDIEVLDTEVGAEGEQATVTVRLESLTAVTVHERQITHRLVRRDGTWYLTPPQADPTVPPEPFVRRVRVDYVSQGRRQTAAVADDSSTDYHDVLDRPRIELGPARLVQVGERWSVVGEVTNIDVDPAQVTVEAILLDAEGRELASSETTVATVHQLLPHETVPYRVDIEGRAGAHDVDDPTAGPFDPTSFTEPVLAAEVAEVQLSARALVTGDGLSRDLSIQGLRVEQGDDGTWVVQGELRNDGVDSATIPHVVITLLDDSGQVAWVDHAWAEEAVRPQRAIPVSIPLTSPAEIAAHPADLGLFANGVRADIDTGRGTIDLPAESGYSAMRIDVVSYYRTSAS